MISVLLALILIQTQTPSAAASAADKFALDLPADDSVTAPAEPVPEASPAVPTVPTPEPPPPVSAAPVSSASGPAAPAAAGARHYSLDTPIADLIADPAAKAVLDRDLPGLSDDENLSKFQALSLRRLAPLSGGQMTGEMLTKVAYDLAALSAGDTRKTAEPRRSLPSGR